MTSTVSVSTMPGVGSPLRLAPCGMAATRRICRSASPDQGDDGEGAGGRDGAGDEQHRVDAVRVRDGERLAGGGRCGGARLDERSERRDPGGDAELAWGGGDAGSPARL